MTCKQLPTNNGLLMCNAVQQCLAANDILLMRKGNRVFSFLPSPLRENGRSFPFRRIFMKKTNSVIE